MLQRAASNAYSWWWASHIRTKQSKWLEQCLQDMEEKVQRILKIIDGDGDSFAKRAEMYYKSRPELITSVEEAFKSFRALADRYDLLSKELQNANHTIATVFPEQVQFGMGEDDDFPIPKDLKNFPPMMAPTAPPPGGGAPIPIPPNMPEAPPNLKTIISAASRQLKGPKMSEEKHDANSGLTKEEALEEIKKLQKEILTLQTVKEFVKSSYENRVSKYWEIEGQIMEMQKRVLDLEDEFHVGAIIDDDEARTLMAEAALKSCEEALSMLQEKQDKLINDAREEYSKIEAACHRVKALRDKYIHDEDRPGDGGGGAGEASGKDVAQLIQKKAMTVDAGPATEETPLEKARQDVDLSNVSSLTVSQMAEKIDHLVNKVITLETAISTQNALVDTLKKGTDNLNESIRKLEDEKETLIEDANNLRMKVKEMEEMLSRIQDLNKNVESQQNDLQMDFADARSSLDHLSDKLTNLKPDEELEEEADEQTDVVDIVPVLYPEGKLGDKLNDQTDVELKDETQENAVEEKVVDDKDAAQLGETATSLADAPQLDETGESLVDEPQLDESGDEPRLGESGPQTEDTDTDSVKEVNLAEVDGSQPSESKLEPKPETKPEQAPKEVKKSVSFPEQPQKDVKKSLSLPADKVDQTAFNAEPQKRDDLSWQQILLSGAEDREMILLKEYTAILRNYKDAKKKLNEMEKKEKDGQFDVTLHTRELKIALLKRDEEIRNLRQRLDSIMNEKDDLEPLPDSATDEGSSDVPSADKDDDEIKSMIDKAPALTKVEAKLRADIDAILEENLDFWLKFSTAYHQVRKFKTEVDDLENESWKLKEKRKPDGSFSGQSRSDAKAIVKHLREIQTELAIWLSQNVSLKDELESRSTSLSIIEGDIRQALQEGAEEEEILFSSLQAAKFQGEIMSMKQENDKVRVELQACLGHVRVLQLEIDKMVSQMNEDFGINEHAANSSRVRIPLRAFLFGSKKKQKQSIFSRIHTSSKKHQPIKIDDDVHMIRQ